MDHLSFDYCRPATAEEAVAALGVPGTRVIAGGTDLIIAMREGKLRPTCLVDVSAIPDMTGIRWKENILEIGAATAFADIAADPFVREEFTALAQAASKVGSPQIRHRGTVGGNIATGSSAGDTLCPLTAFDCRVELAGSEGRRICSLDELWSPEQQAALGERTILTKIFLERGSAPWTSVFVKLGRRESLAISRLSLSVCLRRGTDGPIRDARVAVGSAGRHAYRVPEAETLLCGCLPGALDVRAVQDALSAAVHRALGNRATVRYKAQAIRELFSQAMEELR